MLVRLIAYLETLLQQLQSQSLTIKFTPFRSRVNLEVSWGEEPEQRIQFCWLKTEILTNSAYGIEELCSLLCEKLLKKGKLTK